MITYLLSSFSMLFFFLLLYLDKKTEGAPSGPAKKCIHSALFSSYYRRIVIYFIILLGMPIDLILSSYQAFWSNPLLFFALSCMAFSLMLACSILTAKMRSTGGCWHDFPVPTLKSLIERGFDQSPKDGLLDLFIEEFATREFSEECIDKFLWNSCFDKFEMNSPIRHWVDRFSYMNSENYAVGRNHLIVSDDIAGRLFRESLSRWRATRYISNGGK